MFAHRPRCRAWRSQNGTTRAARSRIPPPMGAYPKRHDPGTLVGDPKKERTESMRRTLTSFLIGFALVPIAVWPCSAEVSIGKAVLGNTLEECGLTRCSGGRFPGHCMPVLILGDEGILQMNPDLPFSTETRVFYGEGERIHYIEVFFHPMDFDRMLTLCTEKFPEPSSHASSTLSNAVGAEFTQEKVTWIVEGNTIFLLKCHSGRVDEGRLSLYTPGALRMFQQREMEEQARQGGRQQGDLAW